MGSTGGNERGTLAGLCLGLPRHLRRASLTKAFMRIKEAKLRRRIVDLVEEIAGDGED